MLKNYLFIFVLLTSFSGFSQTFGIYDDAWRLYRLTIDGNEYCVDCFDELQRDDNGDRILLNVYESPSPNFDTYVCNVKDASFSIDEINNKITILSTSTTLDSCNNLGDPDFEVLYFDFFQDSTVYDYSVSQPNLNIPAYLTITAPNGDTIVYTSNSLSTSNRFELLFSTYPNPVKDQLFISSTNNLSHYNVEIFDVLGKLKISQQLKSNSINVERLPKGFYFLIVKDEMGHMFSKKFVK